MPNPLSDALVPYIYKKDLEMEHERIPFRMPNLNAHIEFFHRILEDDCLSRYEFDSYEEAYRVVTEFIGFYNEQRIHSSR